MTEYKIRLVGGTEEELGILLVSTTNGICDLRFRYRLESLEARAPDCFDAFCKIRLLLERDSLSPYCYGASLNVYPSGMCRDMGEGLVAYRLQLGKESNRNDLVGIFDQGDDVIPSSVENQQRFFDEWRCTKRQ